jgi:diguanylate cyclase (GGDEF)-like protein
MTEEQPNMDELRYLANLDLPDPDTLTPSPLPNEESASSLEKITQLHAYTAARKLVENDQLKARSAQQDAEAEEKDAIISQQGIEMEDLEYRATHDIQTGLLNRPTFLALARERIGHVRRREDRSRKHVLAIADIDDFKLVNDTHGHDEGDHVLDKVSKGMVGKLKQAIAEGLISDGLVARWGGEEFAILLEDVSPDVAYRVLRQMQLVINAVPVRGKRGVGICIGAIETGQGARVSDMLTEADEALYEGKRDSAGKNKIKFAEVNGNGNDHEPETPRRATDA